MMNGSSLSNFTGLGESPPYIPSHVVVRNMGREARKAANLGMCSISAGVLEDKRAGYFFHITG